MAARRRRKAVQKMALMKLADLSSQIRQAVSKMTPGVSGILGAMHLAVTTEDNTVKVVAVPLQQGPSVQNPDGTSSYGSPTWGPCPEDLRAEEYHDPVRPGSVLADTDGTEYVWVAEQGYQLASDVPGGANLGKLATAAHAALDAVVAAAQAK